MKVKALRGFHGQEGSVRRHDVIEVTAARAKQLMNRSYPLVVPFDDDAREVAASTRPSGRMRQRGSPTGAGKSGSSSPRARASTASAPATEDGSPRRRRSKKRAG